MAQLIINEASFTNITLPVDENGRAEDWVELYNNSATALNLAGYSISNGYDITEKWVFPSMTINPNSFIVLLFTGKNTVSGTYIHLSFKVNQSDPKLILRNASNIIIDEYNINWNVGADHSYGRKPDGAGTWFYFNTPGPGQSNNMMTGYDGYAPKPVFSSSGGMYPAAQFLQLYAASGTIRYTTNGDSPGPAAAEYASPISISSTKTISARTFGSANLLPSEVVRNTFLINEDDFNLPVFSVTTDSANLWDYNSGIYVEGPNADTAYPYFGANYWMDWERPCQLEYFDKENVRRFSTSAGLKIFGGYSRVFPQKSFKVKCRSHYGNRDIEWPLIPEKNFIQSYKDLVLRNGGSDFWDTHFRDALMQRIMKKEFVDYMAYEPAVVYLNANFWGFYELRERQDHNYIESNHGVPEDRLDFIEHAGTFSVLAGTDTGFFNMHNYLTTADASSPQFFTNASKKLDLQNFTDYIVAETYYGNTDWIGSYVNNVKLWRPHGGRWRYLLWDLDWGMGLFGSPSTNYLNLVRNPSTYNMHSGMLNALLNNQQFRHYFINRYADLINTVYQQPNVESIAVAMRDEISPVMTKHFAKWGGDITAWHISIQDMLAFNNTRITEARNHVQAEFGLSGQVNVGLDVSPSNSGSVKISTITPSVYPWNGVYFNGVPVELHAIPAPGFAFSHWETQEGELKQESISRNFSANENLVAHFEPVEFAVNVFPSPADDQITINYSIPADGQVSLTLYSILGSKVLDIESSLQAEGTHQRLVSLAAAGLNRGVYILQFTAGDFKMNIPITKH
jgi:hypothetical protein